MKHLFSKIPYLRYAYFYRKNSNHRPGHYYSPVVDLEDLASRKEKIWKAEKELAGIDLNSEEQEKYMAYLIEYSKHIPFTEHPPSKYRYYFDNQMYPHADGCVLFMMLQILRPKRIIEVGSGYSSALIMDTKDEFLKYDMSLCFIDPNPQDRLWGLIRKEDHINTTIIKDIVQNIPIDTFRTLEANDILFIDNSHVSKTGSDVNYLMTEVLPVLNKGVIIHIHDIFFPFEYPEDWLFHFRLNWNEIYMIHNFLLFNNAYKIIFFSDYIQIKYADQLKKPASLFYKSRPGSLWIQRV